MRGESLPTEEPPLQSGRVVDGHQPSDLRFQPAQLFFGPGELKSHVCCGIVVGTSGDTPIAATAAFSEVDDARHEARIVHRRVDGHAGTAGARSVITSSIEPPPGIIGQTFSAG